MENQIKKERTAKNARKLIEALSDTKKDVDKMDYTPDVEHMARTFENLKFAIQLKDMEDMRLYGRKLCAQVTKFMIEKL